MIEKEIGKLRAYVPVVGCFRNSESTYLATIVHFKMFLKDPSNQAHF